MVDDKQARRQQDREAGNVCEMLVSRRYRLNVPMISPTLVLLISQKKSKPRVPAQCKSQDQLSKDDRCPLEIDCLPRVVVEVLDNQHSGVCIICQLGKEPFESSEEWWIVQSPF